MKNAVTNTIWQYAVTNTIWQYAVTNTIWKYAVTNTIWKYAVTNIIWQYAVTNDTENSATSDVKICVKNNVENAVTCECDVPAWRLVWVPVVSAMMDDFYSGWRSRRRLAGRLTSRIPISLRRRGTQCLWRIRESTFNALISGNVSGQPFIHLSYIF